MTPHQVPEVSVAELPDGVALLDVREHDEWSAGHAPTAVHLPIGEVVARVDELLDLFGTQRVHVICRSGGRSARVTEYLNQAGWDAVNVDGGMHAWEQAGRPMAAEAGSPPQVL